MPAAFLILGATLLVATPALAQEAGYLPAQQLAQELAGQPAPQPGQQPAQLPTPQLASLKPAPGVPDATPPVVTNPGPKIIEIAPDEAVDLVEEFDEDEFDGPAHRPPDRNLLLREFPDDYVETTWIQDWQDLERAFQHGRLVDVTSDPEGKGIVLRMGGSGIGQLEDDPYRQLMLCRLARPAAGLLYRIAARMRLVEGEAFEPLEVTSLVRTWHYQLRLTDVNPNADRSKDGVPPTHVLGLAFDIARSEMSRERQHRFELLLDQLAMAGELAYYKEGNSNGLRHYHVIALPSAETLLVRDLERQTRDANSRLVAAGRHRTIPDNPCVAFGSSLEPFSAICSCELPVEVAAATTPADMAVTR